MGEVAATVNGKNGKWNIVGRSGVLGIHAALLHTGKVLFFCRPEDPSHNLTNSGLAPIDNGLPGDNLRTGNEPDVALSAIFEITGPNKYTATAIPIVYNPFCAGHTFLGDGRLLVAGGDKKYNLPGLSNPYDRAPVGTRLGTDRLRVFVPAQDDRPWQDIGIISDARWYPTCTLLPDGSVFVVAGTI